MISAVGSFFLGAGASVYHGATVGGKGGVGGEPGEEGVSGQEGWWEAATGVGWGGGGWRTGVTAPSPLPSPNA